MYKKKAAARVQAGSRASFARKKATPGRQAIVERFRAYTPTAVRGRFAEGVELKFHDIAVDDNIIASAGAIQNAGSVVLIGQGVTESTRIGRKCAIKGINMRYTITLPEITGVADPAAGDVVRVILYLDKQANGATAAVTDILDTADYQSFNNLSNKSRFVTLMDRTTEINYKTLASHGFAADTFDQVQVLQDASFYKRCDIPLEFSGTAAPSVITEVRSNNIGVLLITANGVAGFNSNFRFRFSDGS